MDKILVVNFGSQYNQLIARRIRDLGVYSELVSYDSPIETFMDEDVVGIVLSGGPHSVYDEGSASIDKRIYELGKPVLGICYGMQLTQKLFGGAVAKAKKREFGKATLIKTENDIFNYIPLKSTVWMSHVDHVTEVAEGFVPIAKTDSCIAALKHESLPIYNFQFHPEVTHSKYGKQMIENFVDICGAKREWDLGCYITDTVEDIRKRVGNKKVILGLSGGVDSSVTAMLVHKAIGDQLTCIFVDTGLLRKNEGESVMELYGNHHHLNIIRVNKEQLFLDALKGVTDPETKRKIIGKLFIDVFNEEKEKMSDADFLAQGTIYSDVIESSTKGAGKTIKSHHNVGGLPEDLDFELIEPLADLFKDEVRKVGIDLGIPAHMIYRHPFPGPGLGIRILEEVTKEKADILREADDVLYTSLMEDNLYNEVSQAFVVLLPCKSVGVMGDGRTYEYVCAIRCVDSIDFMTATFSRLPYDFLEKVATRIVNEVDGINRVVFDITSKPPGTVEWE